MGPKNEGVRPKNRSLDAISMPESLGVRDLTYKLCFLAVSVDQYHAMDIKDSIENVYLTQ